MDRIISQVALEDEPMGIVISGGSRVEATPRFSAYVWGPVPEEPEAEAAGTKAA